MARSANKRLARFLSDGYRRSTIITSELLPKEELLAELPLQAKG